MTLPGPRRRLAALVVAALGLVGCVTPSVPIPPPAPESIAFGVDADAGTAVLRYAADVDYAGATVYVFDRDRGAGVIVTAADDGSVETPPFAADDGDEVVVTFEREGSLGSVCVVLHDGPSSSANECSL